ncbi:MAG: UDP-glucose/GDP-mannose dehydrogenase family protein [Gemmatimonadetes bacterium]|nr:UDP-glucose/GDP-mannose dehydrogenase family protein [Gemmatimonadota bacterium]
MHVAVIGTGYVGLVVGACLAESGNDVICADVDEAKIAHLSGGELPIYEPGLEGLVRSNLEEGRLQFTTDVRRAVRESAIIFIAVGTPSDSDGSADLSYVLEVARVIGESMNGEKIVITKSTVPVGTAAKVRAVIASLAEHPVHVCANPEFLKEGAAVEDFLKPDRVVLGVESERAKEVLQELYAPFVRTGNPILFMDIASAELTKYAANAMLATRISFMNLVARMCEKTGADVDLVRYGVGTDSRIGPSFLFPGIGYGGSCFPKDVKALIRTSRELGVDGGMLQAVDTVNEEQKRLLLDRIVERFGQNLSKRMFAVWGLSFKPLTSDMREAPSLVVIRGLLERKARVVAHDPAAMKEARGYFGEAIEYREHGYDCLVDADALVIHTEWQPYRRPDFARMRAVMAAPVIFDGRNLYRPEKMRELGFEYYSVGRPAVVPERAGG